MANPFQIRASKDIVYVTICDNVNKETLKEATRVMLNHYATIVVDTSFSENISNLKHLGYEVQENHTLIKRRVVERGKDIDKVNNEKEIVLAGGCFWGSERVFQMLDGCKTVVGYVNGNVENVTYGEVCEGNTGYKEAVKVVYDPSITPLETIIQAYFMTIHAEQENGQGNDIGEQYQTGIYYIDDTDLPLLQRLYDTEKSKHTHFYPELNKLQNFILAEEYHQNYLLKNPNGYCHISKVDLEKVKALNGR